MPTHKDFKRVVRNRMTKTGESYTAARARLLATTTASTRDATPAPRRRSEDPASLARRAGMSNAALATATGRDWAAWVELLDRVEAHTWPHRRIAEHVREVHGVRPWWTQAVAVGYERIRGLREIGQSRAGAYDASKSRTYPVPVRDLFAAFASPARRRRWLGNIKLTVRGSRPNRAMRITWSDGTSVEAWFLDKGVRKSTVQVSHVKLADRATAARVKVEWAERLDALGKLLEK